MGYGSSSLEKRIKENIKDYTLGQRVFDSYHYIKLHAKSLEAA